MSEQLRHFRTLSTNFSQPTCKNFLHDSTPCLFDSSLPKPWHCPFAVCPQKVFAELQSLFALQKEAAA